MNIAFVNATVRWGGVKTWMLDFAECMKEKGHSLYIYARQQKFVDEARIRAGHAAVVKFGADLNPCAILRFYREFQKHAIDVLFINIEKDLATAGVAAKLLNIPVIQMIGLPRDIPHRLKTECLHRWINPFFLSSCIYIEKGFLQSLPYLDAKQSKVILTAKKEVHAPVVMHTPRRLVATQQLSAEKGHETLLRALADITLPYELHIAGTGDYEAHLRSLAESLGISKHIVWHGFVTDIPSLLLENDIFLLASRSEGLPNTLQEALAAGLLPVIRDVGGVREVLFSDFDPWILPYTADAALFRTKIEAALTLSDAAMLALRQKARACRTKYFDLGQKTDELLQWLQTLAAQKR